MGDALAALVEVSADGLAVLDATLCSPTSTPRLLGTDAAELVGRPSPFGPDRAQDIVQTWRRPAWMG
jgi:hypothetical protein